MAGDIQSIEPGRCLKGEVIARFKNEGANLRAKVREPGLTPGGNERLQQMNAGWLTNPSAQDRGGCSDLYLRFAYLGTLVRAIG